MSTTRFPVAQPPRRQPQSFSRAVVFLPAPSGPAAYEKTGVLTAGTVLAGADVHEAIEAGALTPDTSFSGADVFTATETGALRTTPFLEADAQFTASLAGSLTPGTVLAGTSEKTVGGVTSEKT